MKHYLPTRGNMEAVSAGHALARALVMAVALMMVTGMVAGASAQTIPEEDERPDDPMEGDRRARLIEERMEKRQALEPQEEPGFFEGLVRYVEDKGILQEGAPGGGGFYGFYPVLGGLRSGSGTFTGGIRYEPVDFGESPYLLGLDARVSLRGYWGVSGEAGYRPVEPVLVYSYGQYWHMPDEDFFGIGPATPGEDVPGGLVDYHHDQGLAGGLLAVTPISGLSVGGSASYEWNGISGADDLTSNVTGFEDVPGRGTEINYYILGAFAELDLRDAPRDDPLQERFAPRRLRVGEMSYLAERGVYLGAEVQHYLPEGPNLPYRFTRLNLEAEEYVPLRDDFQMLAFREFVSFSLTEGDHQVPYYIMRTLGGSHTIRGYETFRFRGPHLGVLNAEYRWHVWLMLDMALFADVGYVFEDMDQLRGLTYDTLEKSYGIGFRFRTDDQMFLRVDVAYSEEGIGIYLKLL